MKPLKIVLTICALLLLTGFSITGERDLLIPYNPQTDLSINGIVRTGIMVGPISNFGSIIINGVSYSTDNAIFTIDGLPGIEADLDVGQTVTVRGAISTNLLSGNALSVTYNDNVSGPVQSIDIASSTLIVLGQTIHVDGSTSFGETIPNESLEGLETGNLVEVTGLIDAVSSIAATRIKKIADGSQLDILGKISNFNEMEQTFTLNDAVVDFSSATIEDVTGGQLEDELMVEVQGVELDATGALIADRVIQQSDTLTGNPNDRIELQGFITVFAAANKFSVSANQIKLTPTTLYEDGDATDLLLNARLEVEGSFDYMGDIVASKIKFYQPPVIKIEAPVIAIDASAGALELLGIAVEVTAETRMEDKSNQELSPLSLLDLNPGDYVQIRGVERFDSIFHARATIVERDDPDDRVTLQGFVEAVSEPGIQILGVNCDTTEADFYSLAGEPLSANEFFNQLTEDSLVKVRGMQSGGASILADKVEFESPD